MSRISPREWIPLRAKMLEATQGGRLQDWNERLGEIALFAGTEPASINWSQAPAHVAREIIEYWNQRSSIETLEDAITRYVAEHS